MFRILAIAVFLFVGLSVFSQGQQNPFDLKYRPAKTRTTQPILRDTFKTEPAVQVEEPEVIVPDTAGSIMNVTSSADTGSNPFEISKESVIDTSSLAIAEAPLKQTGKENQTAFPVKKKTSKGIQIFFLLLSLLFLIFIVNVERSFVKDLWRVISNENYSSLHLRNQRNTMRQILLLMGYVVFFIQAGIFLFHTLNAFQYSGTLLDNIWTCMLLVISVYVIRHAAIRYLRWLFNNDKEMTLFGFDVSIFNIMVGLVLLPINIMLNFGPDSMSKPLIYMGLIAAIIAYLMRQLRWLLTARQLITNSLFLFFVYLWAVEILPLWAISKFFW